MMAEGEVLAIEPYEGHGQDEDDQDGYAGETDDEAEVGTVWGVLFDFHKSLDAKRCDGGDGTSI